MQLLLVCSIVGCCVVAVVYPSLVLDVGVGYVPSGVGAEPKLTGLGNCVEMESIKAFLACA